MKNYFDKNNYFNTPDENGFFGDFGGSFVPDIIKNDLSRVKNVFYELKNNDNLLNELYSLLKNYVGRKTPLYFCKNLTKYYKKGKIYLKREDLNHTGAHKINNALGQIFLAKKLNKKKVVAETGAGQHGLATATACALFNIDCEIYMGAVDIERQKTNVDKMKLLGAKVIAVEEGTKTLKEAVDKALEVYMNDLDNTYYLIGSAVGPAPYPEIVRFFQSVIGNEIKEQIQEKEGKLPNYVIACIGGGSNAIGTFYSFLPYETVKLIGIEAAGKGIDTKETAATITKGEKTIIHGFKSYALKDEKGNIADAYSISAGLDYPGVGPELAFLYEKGKIKCEAINDDEAIAAFKLLSKKEGIIPAIESSHALAFLEKLIPKTKKDDIIIVNLSGRGDKDCERILDLE